MATNTYTALRTTTLSSNASSITFNLTGITGYTDLVIVCNIKSLTNGVEFYMRLNSDTATNYSRTILTGNGSSASSARSTSATSMRLAYETVGTNLNNWSTLIINVMNYSNSTTYKTAICRGGDAATEISANVGLWRSTAAINSIQLSGDAAFARSDLAAGSTFTVYGIAAWAPEATPKAVGGYVTSDSTYYYHAFPNSGTFTPLQTLSCDYVVVAGGGGGGSHGNRSGGGAGAGGYLSSVGGSGGGGAAGSAQTLSATNYAVTIGAGGAGAIYPGGNQPSYGSQGSNSVFAGTSTITAIGGGRGGGGNGGSGGGATVDGGVGSGTTGQGYGGGSGYFGSNDPSGGGGGAGQIGGSQVGGSSGNAGSGGNGLVALDGNTYAGGGGGGAWSGTQSSGGTGGGGRGSCNGAVGPAGESGQSATGGGGGGGRGMTNGNGGNGGSGIVIIRYLKA